MKKKIKYLLLIVSIIIITFIVLGGGLGADNKPTPLLEGQSLVFSHRGITDSAVENSQAAFAKSDLLQFKAIETDIRSTKDGKLIIFHDKSCQRLLGIDTNITAVNWADIKNSPLIYNGEKTQNTVFTLDDFLSHTDTARILYLDIKTLNKTIADSLLAILKNHPEHKNIIIADQKLEYLVYLKSKNPNIKVCLEGVTAGKEWLYYVVPKNFKPDYCSSFLSEVDENHMEFIKSHNALHRKITYGVDKNNLHTVFKLGIQNIIVDYDQSMGPINRLEANLMKNKL